MRTHVGDRGLVPMDACCRAFSSPTWTIAVGAATSRSFPPGDRNLHRQLAGVRVDALGRSCSPWYGTAIARPCGWDGVVSSLASRRRPCAVSS
jgi:hypothetical protein